MIHRTAREIISDRVSLVAAGCAFYATLALFPAISMLIFLYGLVFDPVTVEPQLQVMRELLPPSAFQLISDRVHQLVTQRQGTLGLGLVISTLITLWSSATGTKSAHRRAEHGLRGAGEAELLALPAHCARHDALRRCSVLSLAIAILVFLPAVISFFGIVGTRDRLCCGSPASACWWSS